MYKVNRNSDSFLYQNSDMSIGKRVREARVDAELTQKQLAAKVGISQPTLSELENGDSAGTAYIATMAAALGVNALWLETGKGPKTASQPYKPAEIGTAPALTQEVLELVALYGEANGEWRQRIIDLARTAAEQSKGGDPGEKLR